MPAELRRQVINRDQRCVGPKIGMPHGCEFPLEVDHVRASGGLGMKSPTTADNLVTLCRGHHRMKTEGGRTWRPLLIEYLRSVTA